MSEFHCLVIVLFSAMFSCFLLELQDMVSTVSQNMEPLSLRSTSLGVRNAQVMMNMPTIRYFFLMLETEKLIPEIDIDHILQEAPEL